MKLKSLKDCETMAEFKTVKTAFERADKQLAREIKGMDFTSLNIVKKLGTERRTGTQWGDSMGFDVECSYSKDEHFYKDGNHLGINSLIIAPFEEELKNFFSEDEWETIHQKVGIDETRSLDALRVALKQSAKLIEE